MWTADRLERRGLQNCGLCKLCNQVQESAKHLLYQCRFTIRVWSNLKEWLGLQDVEPRDWHVMRNVKEWWIEVIHKHGESRKALATLAILVSWEVWRERNVCVFRNQYFTIAMIVAKIKEEAKMWCLAGAKTLSNVMPRE